MQRSLVIAVLLCLAAASAPSASDDRRGRVRPMPPPSVDDSVHTRDTARWLGPGVQRRAPGREVPPYFEDVSVHDPAILEAEGRYYIFGSHLAAARSDDLLRWESIADGVHPQNPLFDNVLVELRETLDWAETDTLWAPDVIRLADGRYYMYYNACRGDSPRSALGLAVADRPEGPYRNQGILLRSGMWGQPSEDGTIYDAQVHPNTVDPDVKNSCVRTWCASPRAGNRPPARAARQPRLPGDGACTPQRRPGRALRLRRQPGRGQRPARGRQHRR